MKYVAILITLVLTACQEKTEFGPCVGITDKQDVKLEYKLSERNTVIGIVFAGFIFPAVIVLANETFCPVRTAK